MHILGAHIQKHRAARRNRLETVELEVNCREGGCVGASMVLEWKEESGSK